MKETIYKIRATLNAELVKKVEKTTELTLKKNTDGTISACWEVTNDQFHDVLEQLNSLSITSFLIEVSGVQIYMSVQKTNENIIYKKIAPYTVGSIQTYRDYFYGGSVYSFIVSKSDCELVYNIMKEYNIVQFIGIECFTVLKDIPDFKAIISPYPH